MTDAPATWWVPPDPQQLPEWRAHLIEYTASMPALQSLREAIHAGRGSIVPAVPDMDASASSIAAQILSRSEVRRLEEAALYYVTGDMTALALAAAQTPPTEPMTIERLPAESGLIVFAEPIGGYTEDAAAALAGTPAYLPGATAEVTTPIVAVSWSVWSPGAVQLDRGSVAWQWKGRGGSGVIRDDWRGVWVTFYSPRGLFSGLAPDTPIGTMLDGSVMTAGQIERERSSLAPPLQWDNEMLLTEGAPFEAPAADTTAQWAHVLYTAWQLMTATGGTRWAEVEEIPRERAGRRRDARQGITGPSTVRVVHVHTAHRPPRQAAAAVAAASTGRREPSWSCRWPVRPHRRDHCMNPRLHAAGDCRHEDRLIPGYVKGPQDKPLRTGSTVHLWDSQPPDPGTT